MADTTIRPPRSIELEPELRAAPAALEADQIARERFFGRLRLLWQNRHWILRVVMVGAVIATLSAFLIPARYTSTVRLMPPDNRSSAGLALAALAGRGSSTGAASSLLGDLGSDLLGLRSSSDLFAAVLKSHTVEDRLIAQFNLKRVYWDRRIEDARRDLENHTDISVDRKSQMVVVKVTDKDRDRAAAMARMYVDELNRAVAEVSTSSARRERIFLEGRLKEVKVDLEAAEKDFSQYASKNTTIDVKEQGKAMVEAAANLQGELIAAQSRLQEMRQIYTGNNIRVRGLEARVAELQNQLNKVGGKDDSTSLPADGDSLYPSIRKLPLLGVSWSDLYRRVKIQEIVFETLTQQYELARVEEAKEIPTVKVLDAPDVPEKKSFPPRLLIILLGTALSFGLAVVCILGAAKWRELSPADPMKVLAGEILGGFKTGDALIDDNGTGHYGDVRNPRIIKSPAQRGAPKRHQP